MTEDNHCIIEQAFGGRGCTEFNLRFNSGYALVGILYPQGDSDHHGYEDAYG